MTKIWKKINTSEYKNIAEVRKKLLKKRIILSHWIIDILENKKNNIKLEKKKIKLYRIKVKNLGFKKPTTLKKIYNKIKIKGYELVSLDIALIARLKYSNQKKGEWLRFATPFNSMIDRDNVPHLPKLGKALNKLFIETYWSYKGAIFHPKNEFVVCKNDSKKIKNK